MSGYSVLLPYPAPATGFVVPPPGQIASPPVLPPTASPVGTPVMTMDPAVQLALLAAMQQNQGIPSAPVAQPPVTQPPVAAPAPFTAPPTTTFERTAPANQPDQQAAGQTMLQNPALIPDKEALERLLSPGAIGLDGGKQGWKYGALLGIPVYLAQVALDKRPLMLQMMGTTAEPEKVIQEFRPMLGPAAGIIGGVITETPKEAIKRLGLKQALPRLLAEGGYNIVEMGSIGAALAVALSAEQLLSVRHKLNYIGNSVQGKETQRPAWQGGKLAPSLKPMTPEQSAQKLEQVNQELNDPQTAFKDGALRALMLKVGLVTAKLGGIAALSYVGLLMINRNRELQKLLAQAGENVGKEEMQALQKQAWTAAKSSVNGVSKVVAQYAMDNIITHPHFYTYLLATPILGGFMGMKMAPWIKDRLTNPVTVPGAALTPATTPQPVAA